MNEKLNIKTRQDPAGHSDNATMTNLHNGKAVTIAVHVVREAFDGLNENQIAEKLSEMLMPLTSHPGIAGINVEIGDEDGE